MFTFLQRLRCHDWRRSNVRELNHVLKQALLLADGPTVGVEHLPLPTGLGNSEPVPPRAPRATRGARHRVDAVVIEGEAQAVALKALVVTGEGGRDEGARSSHGVAAESFEAGCRRGR